jgi:nucleoid-associated protein YejK
MYTLQEVKEEAVIELNSWDAPVNSNTVITMIEGWINNLKSHIGKEAHEYEAQFIKDETGMSWEEQDAIYLEQIKDYENALKEIKKDQEYDWQPLEKEMLEWARTH